jgi:putative tributyrin esterase
MPRFEGDPLRTLEISDPAFEREGVRFVTTYSPSLRGRGDLSVFVPERAERVHSLPVVLLLHGVYGSHWAWFFKGSAHRTATELIAAGQMRPMLLVAPSDGLYQDGSGYLPHSGADYEAWIVRDVLLCLRKAFPFIHASAPIFLSGLSMGGYGALRLGAKYPRMFAGISAHSAITRIDEMKQFVFEPFPYDEISSSEHDILDWIDRNSSALPPLRFDCGVDDQLIAGNRTFHRELSERKIPHVYAEFPGSHTWEYWSTHLRDSLLFFEEILTHRIQADANQIQQRVNAGEDTDSTSK